MINKYCFPSVLSTKFLTSTMTLIALKFLTCFNLNIHFLLLNVYLLNANMYPSNSSLFWPMFLRIHLFLPFILVKSTKQSLQFKNVTSSLEILFSCFLYIQVGMKFCQSISSFSHTSPILTISLKSHMTFLPSLFQ